MTARTADRCGTAGSESRPYETEVECNAREGLDAIHGRIPNKLVQLQAEADREAIGENPLD